MKALLQEISIDNFDLSLSGLRISKPDQVTAIEIQMTKHGQLQPMVVRHAEGRYQIIDGFKRYYAAMEIMLTTLQCYILDVDLQQAKILALSYNRSGRTMEVWEEALILSDLASSHGLSQKSLSKLTGYSRSWVSRRLSLISRLSVELIIEIRMGTLSSSQARALIKLPRGNQIEVADVITTCYFSSRQSDILVEAFLKAKDRSEQQQILTHPELTIVDHLPMYPYPSNAPRLSDFGNDLLNVIRDALSVIGLMLKRLHPEQTDVLKETEKTILIPELALLGSKAQRLIKAITELQNLKDIENSER